MNLIIYKRKILAVFVVVISCFLLLFHMTKIGNTSEKIENLKGIVIGDDKAPVKIIVYSSLTCPHCATFHINTLPKIKKEYVDTDKVQIILKDFPLDLASLNAAKLVKCAKGKEQLLLLDHIYENQEKWTKGIDVDSINKNLVEIASKFNINSNQANKCLQDQDIEEDVLNSRINALKKYDINATPAVIINEKKLDGPSSFENIKKTLKKII